MLPVENVDKLNTVSILELVTHQRTSSAKDIKKLHKDLKSFFHTAEYKLIKGLVDGLEKSLMLEYLIYIEEEKSNKLELYDFWAFNKIIAIYKKSI